MNEIALTLAAFVTCSLLLYQDHFVGDSTSAVTTVDSLVPSTEKPHQHFLPSLSRSSQVYTTNLESLFILLLLGQYPKKSFGFKEVLWLQSLLVKVHLSVVGRTSVLIFTAGKKIPFLTSCLTQYFTFFTILTNPECFQVQTKHLICYSFRKARVSNSFREEFFLGQTIWKNYFKHKVLNGSLLPIFYQGIKSPL